MQPFNPRLHREIVRPSTHIRWRGGIVHVVAKDPGGRLERGRHGGEHDDDHDGPHNLPHGRDHHDVGHHQDGEQVDDGAEYDLRKRHPQDHVLADLVPCQPNHSRPQGQATATCMYKVKAPQGTDRTACFQRTCRASLHAMPGRAMACTSPGVRPKPTCGHVDKGRQDAVYSSIGHPREPHRQADEFQPPLQQFGRANTHTPKQAQRAQGSHPGPSP